MAWAKFDDRWATHPKLLAAGLEAKGLDASGICYAAGQETDGFVPDTALIILGAGHRNPRKVADRLVEVGRWIRDDERRGYVIHDFDRYNFTRAQGEAKRTRDAERKAAARKKQGRDARGRITSTRIDPDVRTDTDPDPPGLHEESAWTPPPVPPVPTRPDPTPTNRSSSSDRSAEAAGAEEEDHDPVARVCRLVAECRYGKLSDPPPVGFRQDRWLVTTGADVLAKSGDNIRTLLAGGQTVEQIVDLFEPPDRPPEQPPAPSREHVRSPFDQVWDEQKGEWKTVRVSA